MDSSALLPLPTPPHARTTVVGPGAEGAPCALGMSGSSTDEKTIVVVVVGGVRVKERAR